MIQISRKRRVAPSKSTPTSPRPKRRAWREPAGVIQGVCTIYSLQLPQWPCYRGHCGSKRTREYASPSTANRFQAVARHAHCSVHKLHEPRTFNCFSMGSVNRPCLLATVRRTLARDACAPTVSAKWETSLHRASGRRPDGSPNRSTPEQSHRR